MRVLLRTLIIALSCVALVLVYTATTEGGLRLLWRNLQPLLPASLSIDSVEGRLTGPLTVTGLQFSADSLTLVIDAATLDWTPYRLLSGLLQLDSLVLEGVRYTPREKPQPAATEPVDLPERIALPLGFNLEQFRVRNLALHSATGSHALLIEQGDASLSYRDSTLAIRLLSVQSKTFQVEANGRLEAAGDYPLEALLNWRLSPADYAEIQGRTAVSGTFKRLLVEQTFNETYPLSGEFVLTSLLDSPSLAARVKVDGLALETIKTDLPAVRLVADIEAEGPLNDLALSGALAIDGEALPTVQATIAARTATDRIEFEQLQLSVPVHEAELQISGPINFAADAMRFDLHADWRQLRWPFDGDAQVKSPAGRLHVSGSLDDYQLEAQTTVAAPGHTEADLSLQGVGNLDALRLSELTIDTLDGRLEGNAAVAWRPRLETSLALNGSSLDPGELYEAWPGKLDIQLKGTVETSAAGIVAELPLLRASGELRDLPLQLESQAGYRNDTLTIETLALSSGPSSLQLSGSIGTRFDFEWRLDSPDLSTLLPTAKGRLAGAGQLSGTTDAPVGRVSLSGSDLRYGSDDLSAIELDAAVDMTAATASSLELTLGKGRIQGVTLNSLALSANGLPTQHSLTLSTDNSLVYGQLAATGRWQDQVWQFDLQEAELGHADFAPWSVVQSLRGRLGQGSFSAEPSCWRSGGARLCLNGRFAAGKPSGKIELRDLPLAYFSSLLPAGVEAQGTLAVDGEMQEQAEQPTRTRLQLDSNALALVFPGDKERPAVRVEATEAKVALVGDAKRTRLEGTLLLNNDTRLSLDATINGTEQEFLSRPLTGQASIDVPDLAFLGKFTPQVSDPQGAIQGRVQISGNLQAPVLQGLIRSTDTQLTLDAPGITLEDIELTLRGEPDGDIALDLAARSGDGQLRLAGTSNLFTEPRTADFTVRGNDFEVIDTREARISASPDLKLALKGNQLDVDGQIEVPSARIRPRKLPESAVRVSPDQIIVKEDEEATGKADLQVSSRVRFILGEQVKFDGFGLKGRITGNILAKDRPGKPTTASGELAIQDGQYRAYGQNLNIRRGRLLFAGGPVTEPGLDIEAIRRPAPDILVGVRARGSLRKPDFSLFSEPSMSQSDQLSWLVLGRPLESDVSSQERNSMNQAAIMLGLGGGLALTEEFGEKLGIDEISIESEPTQSTSSDPAATTNQASLLVGKYLSPELFVSYGVGIFEPVSTLRFRYALGSKWKLVGESSALRSSADLFYIIERGN